MLIDSHAHLNLRAFKNDADEVIRRCFENDIWMINVGTDYITSERAIELSKKYENGVYAAAGFHPIHLETGLVKIKKDANEAEEDLSPERKFDYK
ncbi:MAG: TatD family hydrolase, partial [Candidatus Parcubacteria bacterium]|nr:TatD family hydrolase [Candidatus Parcubacteria bacterium]